MEEFPCSPRYSFSLQDKEIERYMVKNDLRFLPSPIVLNFQRVRHSGQLLNIHRLFQRLPPSKSQVFSRVLFSSLQCSGTHGEQPRPIEEPLLQNSVLPEQPGALPAAGRPHRLGTPMTLLPERGSPHGAPLRFQQERTLSLSGNLPQHYLPFLSPLFSSFF